ncbi:MAG: hypothetical protein WDZ83_12240 [Rhizobiaceae bacterium]
MAGIFRAGEEKPQARYEYRARILTKPGAEKHANPVAANQLMKNDKLQSFQLGLSASGQRRARLTVPAPRRPALLAVARNPGAQTIPFEKDALWSDHICDRKRKRVRSGSGPWLQR